MVPLLSQQAKNKANHEIHGTQRRAQTHSTGPVISNGGERQKMIKPQMTKVIAERSIESTLSEGRSETLLVQVGHPARDPNPGGDWYCPLRIKGKTKERLHACFGIDKLQALQFALGLLEPEVRAFAENCQLSWLGQKRLGLKPWTPRTKKLSPKCSPSQHRSSSAPVVGNR